MKISREGAVIVILTLFVAVLAGNVGAWFKCLFWVIGIWIGINILLEVLKQTATKSEDRKEKIKTVQNKLLGGQELSMSNIGRAGLAEIEAVYKSIPLLSITDVELAFAIGINAIAQNQTKLPDNMIFIIARKALYEVEKKRGNLRFSKLESQPYATKAEIMRPLEVHEVFLFNTFCSRYNSFFDLSKR